MKFTRKIREYYHILIKGRESPERIARGIALGVFIAFSPLLGFHTILCIIFSIICNASKSASIFGSLIICNPITIPIIYFSEYEIGKFTMINFNFEPDLIRFSDFNNLNLNNLIELGKSVIIPVCIGFLILGSFFSIIAYFYSKRYFKKIFNEI